MNMVLAARSSPRRKACLGQLGSKTLPSVLDVTPSPPPQPLTPRAAPTANRYAAMGVGNLATNLSNQEKILNEGALQPLISLARRDNGDLESQRYAVFALTNVAATSANHAKMLAAGVCELVAGLLDAEDVEIRNSAAFCVGNFASNSDNHAALSGEGVLGPLIELVASSDPEVGRQEGLRGPGRVSRRPGGAVQPCFPGSHPRSMSHPRGNPRGRLQSRRASLALVSVDGALVAGGLRGRRSRNSAGSAEHRQRRVRRPRRISSKPGGGCLLPGESLHDAPPRRGDGKPGALVPSSFATDARQAQLRAASAIRGLSVDEDLRNELVARGGLIPLLRLANSDDVEIQMEVRAPVSRPQGFQASATGA